MLDITTPIPCNKQNINAFSVFSSEYDREDLSYLKILISYTRLPWC
jgi:hypothetical protein